MEHSPGYITFGVTNQATGNGRKYILYAIPNIFSNHNAMKSKNKLQERKIIKITNTCRLISVLLNNQWITEEIKEEATNT